MSSLSLDIGQIVCGVESGARIRFWSGLVLKVNKIVNVCVVIIEVFFRGENYKINC